MDNRFHPSTSMDCLLSGSTTMALIMIILDRMRLKNFNRLWTFITSRLYNFFNPQHSITSILRISSLWCTSTRTQGKWVIRFTMTPGLDSTVVWLPTSCLVEMSRSCRVTTRINWLNDGTFQAVWNSSFGLTGARKLISTVERKQSRMWRTSSKILPISHCNVSRKNSTINYFQETSCLSCFTSRQVLPIQILSNSSKIWLNPTKVD